MLPAQKAENNREQTQNNREALTREGHRAITGNKKVITQKCRLGKLIPVSLFILTDLKLYRADGDVSLRSVPIKGHGKGEFSTQNKN